MASTRENANKGRSPGWAPGFFSPKKGKKKPPKSPLASVLAAGADQPLQGKRGAGLPSSGETAPTVAKSPKLSAYDRQRKGIMDLYNDPQWSAYNESYLPNYDIARGQIENAFAQAMGEVQSRQAAGQGLLNTMPGQIDANYGQATANVGANNAALAQAQANMGVQTYMAPGEATAPVTAAMQYEQAAAKSQVPTLGVGLNNLVSEQRQQLGTDRGTALSDIAMQEQEARAGQAQMRADAENERRSRYENAMLDAEVTNEAEKKANHKSFGNEYIGQDRGADTAESLPRLTERVRSGKGDGASQDAYNFVTGQLKGLAGLGPKRQAKELARIMKDARKKWPHRTNVISLAMYDIMG